MNRLFQIANTKSKKSINCESKKIHLKEWIDNKFSTLNYRLAAKGHWAMAVSRDKKIGDITINVESIGGHLMIQNYHTKISSAKHMQFVSEKTDFWIFHLVHIFVKVITDIHIKSAGKNKSFLTCHVQCFTRNPIIWFFSKICLTNFFVVQRKPPAVQVVLKSFSYE